MSSVLSFTLTGFTSILLLGLSIGIKVALSLESLPLSSISGRLLNASNASTASSLSVVAVSCPTGAGVLDTLVLFVLSGVSSIFSGVTGAIVSVGDSTFSGVTEVFGFASGVSVTPLRSLSDWPVASTSGEVVVWSLVTTLSVSENS